MIDGRLEASIDSIHHVLASEGLDPVRVVGVLLHVPEEAVAPHPPPLGPRPLDHLVRLVEVVLAPLKGQCHEIICFRFFPESSSPKPLKIAIG